MLTVSVHTAKTQLSALLHSVEERHERIIISRYGKAIAELVPLRHGKRSVSSPDLSGIKFHADATESTQEEWEDA